jgi:hypothetical protein
MSRILSLFLVAALSTMHVVPASAQTVAAPAAVAVGTAYVAKKAVGTCLRHPVLCAATAAVGAGYVYKAAQSTRKLDAETPECREGYVPLYRAVGRIERLEIAAIQRYVVLPTGIGAKQFMLSLEDAKFIATFNQRYETTAAKEMFIVTSRICAATLSLADRFSDAGRPVASFTPAALKFVNLDASRTGGIQEVWASGALK